MTNIILCVIIIELILIFFRGGYYNMTKFIEKISVKNGIPNGLSIEDLYAYSKSMMFDYIEDHSNVAQLKKTEELARKIIEIEDNERAYSNYLFILINSGQYFKAFEECKKLLKKDKFKRFALANLCDDIFVETGFIDNKNRCELLRKRLLLSQSESERKYIKKVLSSI